MSIGITIILCSLCYILIIISNYYSKERVKSLETKLYGLMIVFSVLSLLFEFLSIIFVSDYNNFYIQSQIVNRIFILCVLYWSSILTFYIYSVSFIKDSHKNIDSKQVRKPFLFILSILTLVFSILIIVLPLEFYNQGNTMYSYGPAADIVSIIVGTYIVIWLFCIFKNFQYLRNKKYLPILIFIICIIITLFVRTIDPGILLINATVSLVTVLMYHTIENPDLKMLYEMEFAKDLAEKANRAKSDFLSSMSHEIRTPLNAILGFSQLNKDAETLEEAKETATDIITAANTLHDIVGNVLDMSKIEAGDIELIEKDYSPHEMLDHVIKLSEFKMKEKNLELKVKIAPDLPSKLLGDKANVQKVILNILTNAMKYTDEGYVLLEVNCINTNDLSKIILSVEDTGRGIKKEHVDKLFNKFSRLEEDVNTTIEGTGLGLAITKHILELMGGSITVQSIYGQGSKFTVTFVQKILTENSSNQVIKEREDKVLNFPNKKVLVVDDNELNLKVAKKLLAKYNIVVEDLTNGQECIAKVEAGNTYDLILLDQMMPKLNGTQVMKAIKATNYDKPIVVITADVESCSREKYLSLGFDDYLAKPLNIAELEQVLTKYLR